MKKLVFLICFLSLGFIVNSQTRSYVGIIYDNKSTITSVRPSINVRFNETEMLGMDNYSVVGMSMNTLGKMTFSIGFDLKKNIIKNNSIIGGFSVDIFGWKEVYKGFMPSLRFGIETKNIMILGISNWEFKQIPIGYETALEPRLIPTIGVFYKINQR